MEYLYSERRKERWHKCHAEITIVMEENIKKVRKDSIIEIKEKVKKNLGYLHPCNKEIREKWEVTNRLDKLKELCDKRWQ